MVKNRHEAPIGIPELGFAAPVGTPSRLEVLSLSELRSRADQATLGTVRRRTFHELLMIEDGYLRHSVDFVEHVLTPGMWSWVKPGQVQWWGDVRMAEGTLVLFESDLLESSTAAAAQLDNSFAAAPFEPVGSDRKLLSDSVALLGAAVSEAGGLPLDVHRSVLRHLLSALVLQLAHLWPLAQQWAGRRDEPYWRFSLAVERDITRTRRLDDYARELGYSARTLSRATQAAVGVNAKEFIDRRMILEAKRMLAHSDSTAAQVASYLGFSSPTNFSKYFRQRTGSTPVGFRQALRS